MSDPTPTVRVLTWNLFHGHDGARLGPTLGSTLAGRDLDNGTHLHINKKWLPEMGALIASRTPDVVALQEVPPLGVEILAAATGMTAFHSLMPPLVGTTVLRGRLAARNPDLWRTHEGTANVILVGPGWQAVPGGSWTVRHNPAGFVARRHRRLGLARGEALHWLLEPRRLVAVRLRHQRIHAEHGAHAERERAPAPHGRERRRAERLDGHVPEQQRVDDAEHHEAELCHHERPGEQPELAQLASNGRHRKLLPGADPAP